MAWNFGFNNQEQEQTTYQDSSSYGRQDQRSSQTSERSIAPAGEMESETLSQLMSSLYKNLQGASGLISGGYNDAINEAINQYNRTIESGANSALGVMAKSGMRSSLVNSMMGTVNRSASEGLSNTLVNLRANMPFQAINAVNSAASPLMSLLSNYFLGERSQNVTQSGQGSMSGSSSSESSGTSTSHGSSSGTQFGFGG